MTTTDKGAPDGSARVTDAERWARARYEAMLPAGGYPTWEDMPERGREAHIAAMRPIAAEMAERDAQIARLARENDATEAALRAQIEALTSELAEARSLADGAGAACLAWEEKARSGELVHRDDRDAWRSLAIARGRIIAAEEGGTDLQTRAALVGDALSALAKLYALGVEPGETC